MIMDTITTKEMKKGYAAALPQFPARRGLVTPDAQHVHCIVRHDIDTHTL